MTRLMYVASVALAVIACKTESSREAERAAERVTEQREEMRKAPAEEKIGEGMELVGAELEYSKKRDVRIAELRAQHSVAGTQSMLVGVMATHFPLTDAGRGDVNIKLTAFQLLLDETGNLIEGLQTVPADVWVERDEATTAAMSRLDAARLEAWNALDKAPRLEQPAS